MYCVSVRRHFESAHALRGYQGKCENLHGHRYEVVVSFEASELNALGLAVDFRNVKRALDAIVEDYDHHQLNDIEPFDEINPSAENIARTIYEKLEGKVNKASLREVQVWESPDAWVTYSRD